MEQDPLAGRLAAFLWVVAPWLGRTPSLADDLRYPEGSSGHLRGSSVGATLWSTPAATTLLDLIADDGEVLTAFGENPTQRDTARRTVAEVVATWQATGSRPEAFAGRVAPDLWHSMRRRDVHIVTASIVERVIAPPDGLAFQYGHYAFQPVKPYLAWAFSRAWPDYYLRLPAGPFAVFLTSLSVPRTSPGGPFPLPLGRLAVHLARDAIWLATGEIPRIGDAVAWDEHSCPSSSPLHFPPEIGLYGDLKNDVDLVAFRGELTAIVPRLAVLEGSEPSPAGLDPITGRTLRGLKDQVKDATRAGRTESTLLHTFAAAEGALREPPGTDRPRDEPERVVGERFGPLCATTLAEPVELTELITALRAVRDKVAHGRSPTNREMARFLGQAAPAPPADGELWDVSVWNPSRPAVRRQALQLLRRLYRAWLLATFEVQDGSITPRMTRADLIALAEQASHGDQAAQARLIDLNNLR
jgi:hypothetical protein